MFWVPLLFLHMCAQSWLSGAWGAWVVGQTERPCDAGKGLGIVILKPWLWGRGSRMGSGLCKAKRLVSDRAGR